MARGRARAWVVAWSALLLPGAGLATAPPQSYVVGVIPQAPPLAMHAAWSPIVERLAARSGISLRLKVYEDMGAFARDYAAGGPDILFAHPAMAADAHRVQGYLPLVRDRRRIAGILFVRRDSPYRTPRDLEGKGIAFVGDRAYCTALVAASLDVPGTRLRFDRQYAGSSQNVLRAVILGKAEAGASMDFALEDEPEETRALVRPILTTAKTASHPLAAHPRVPPEVRLRLTAALLEMARDPGDRPLLAAVRMPDPEPADYERDYRALEPRR